MHILWLAGQAMHGPLLDDLDMVRSYLFESDPAQETARILFLTYGHDAVQMAVLRCAELTKAGDKAGLAAWKKVLKNVRKLAVANPKHSATIN